MAEGGCEGKLVGIEKGIEVERNSSRIGVGSCAVFSVH